MFFLLRGVWWLTDGANEVSSPVSISFRVLCFSGLIWCWLTSVFPFQFSALFALGCSWARFASCLRLIDLVLHSTSHSEYLTTTHQTTQHSTYNMTCNDGGPFDSSLLFVLLLLSLFVFQLVSSSRFFLLFQAVFACCLSTGEADVVEIMGGWTVAFMVLVCDMDKGNEKERKV